MYRLLLLEESCIQQMRPQLLHLFVDLLEIFVQILVEPRERIFELLHLGPQMTFNLLYPGLHVFLHGGFTVLHLGELALEDLCDLPQLLDLLLHLVPLLLVILRPLVCGWKLGDLLLSLDHVHQSIYPRLYVGHPLVHVLLLLALPVSTLCDVLPQGCLEGLEVSLDLGHFPSDETVDIA